MEASPGGYWDPSPNRGHTLLEGTPISNAELEAFISCALSRIEAACWVKLRAAHILQALTYLPFAIETLVT